MPTALTQKDAVNAFLRDEDATGTALLVLAVDRLTVGKDNPLAWLPETVHFEITQELGPISDHNFNKFMAAWTVHESDRFFTNLRDWVLLCPALIDGDVDFHHPDLPEPGVFVPAVYEAVLLHAVGKRQAFAPEIHHYLELSLAEHGAGGVRQTLGVEEEGDDEHRRRGDFVFREHGREAFESYRQRAQEESARLGTLGTEHVRRIFHQLRRLPLRQGSIQNLLGQNEPSP